MGKLNRRHIVLIIIFIVAVIYMLDNKPLRIALHNGIGYAVPVEISIDNEVIFKGILKENNLLPQVYSHKVGLGFHEMKVADKKNNVSVDYSFFVFKKQRVNIAVIDSENPHIEINIEYIFVY